MISTNVSLLDMLVVSLLGGLLVGGVLLSERCRSGCTCCGGELTVYDGRFNEAVLPFKRASAD